MNDSVKMIVVMAIVSLIAGMSLALVYLVTKPDIELNQKKALEEAIFELFPSGKEYKVVGAQRAVPTQSEKVFRVKGAGSESLGYAFIAQGNGYQGNIKMMVGLKNDKKTLSGIEVLESVETPGLGGKIADEEFKSQFKNLKTTPEIKIQAITAATISSKAVVNIINKRIEEVREILRK